MERVHSFHTLLWEVIGLTLIQESSKIHESLLPMPLVGRESKGGLVHLLYHPGNTVVNHSSGLHADGWVLNSNESLTIQVSNFCV
jgi:hypothetical protein